MSIARASVPPSSSAAFAQMDEFRRRDERGGQQPVGEKPSYTSDEVADHIGTEDQELTGDFNRNGKTELTYSFLKRPTQNFAAAGLRDFSAFNTQQQDDARAAMQSYQDVANVTFKELPEKDEGPLDPYLDGEGHFGFGNFGATADPKKGMRGITIASGERLGYESFYRDTPISDSVVFPSREIPQPLLKHHEVGHMLRQGHPGFYNGNHELGFDEAKTYKQDTNAYTVMSYWPETHSGHDFRKNGIQHHPKGLMMDDIPSIQKRYGANHETRAGDTVYGFGSNSERNYYSLTSADDTFVASIWDGGGHDTVDMRGYRDNQKINLNAGKLSDVGGMKGNLSIAPGVTIEDAVGGSGNDMILGNQAANKLRGRAGDDILDGDAGADKLWGGKGRDTFLFSDACHSTARAPDRIMDFRSGEDTIDVSRIRAATGTPGLTYVSRFSGKAGEAMLTYYPDKGLSTLEIDVRGQGKADFMVKVKGEVFIQDIVA